MSALAGRVVLVTGAARGIGAAVAREVARRGGRVALVGLEPERLRSVTDALPVIGTPHLGRGRRHRPAAARAAGRRGGGAARAARRRRGQRRHRQRRHRRHHAGRGARPHGRGQPDRRHAHGQRDPPARRGGEGPLLLVSSAASFTPAPGLAAYSASKAGAEGFGDAFRLEVAHQGVTVGTAHPIWIDTDLVRDAQADLPIFRQAMEAMPRPLGVQGRPDLRPPFRRRHRAATGQGLRTPGGAAVFHLRTLITAGLVRRVMTRQAAPSVPGSRPRYAAWGAPSAATPPASAVRIRA